MATYKSIVNKYLTDSDAFTLGVGTNATNIALLAFKMATNDGLSIFNLQDGFMDEYEDETGIDTGNSLNETYDSTNDLYSVTGSVNLTLISAAQTAVTAGTGASDARLVIFEEDVDACTINTDILAYVSKDSGTTYTQVTLADHGTYESGKKLYAGTADISAQPSGTAMRYKITGANNKDFKIHGVSMTWGV